MKKHILLGAALLSLFAASCSNEDIVENDTEVVTGKIITLNANINNGTDTRMTYTDNGSSMNVAWSNNEKFTMYKGKNSTGSKFSNSADATDTFKGNDIEDEGKYYAVYGDNITNTDGKLTIDLSQAQVGTKEEKGIKEFMLATADALNSSTTLTFDHKLTVLKMTLTLPSDMTGSVSKVTVSGLHNKASYSLSEGSYAYTDDGKGDITATNGTTGFAIADNKITAYVAVFPENVSANQVTIKATVGDNEYSYTIVGARKLTAGKVVPVSASLALVEKNFKSAYTIKDYFYWDAYTYVTNGENSFSKGNYGYHTGSSVTAEHSCASCPTFSQMVAYLKAGVYWDDNTTVTKGQMTYSAPSGNGSETVTDLHTGLWVKKKSKIENFDSETFTEYYYKDTPKKLSSLSADEVKNIRTGGDYFFLPATGCYNRNGFSDAGFYGYYWLSSSYYENNNYYAYYLDFSGSYASVYYVIRGYGCLPMVSE